jgi:hypothetical protein
LFDDGGGIRSRFIIVSSGMNRGIVRLRRPKLAFAISCNWSQSRGTPAGFNSGTLCGRSGKQKTPGQTYALESPASRRRLPTARLSILRGNVCAAHLMHTDVNARIRSLRRLTSCYGEHLSRQWAHHAVLHQISVNLEQSNTQAQENFRASGVCHRYRCVRKDNARALPIKYTS